MSHAPGVAKACDSQSAPRSKAEFRALARARRSAIGSPPDLTGPLLEAVAAARVVACYASVAPEPDTWGVIAALTQAGARVLLPVLGRRPDWAVFEGVERLTPSWRSIPVPDGPRLGPAALRDAEAIVLPGLAGTPGGGRLGTGGGWYDRALAWASPSARRVLALYPWEVLDELPLDGWDEPVDVIATPVGVTWTRRV